MLKLALLLTVPPAATVLPDGVTTASYGTLLGNFDGLIRIGGPLSLAPSDKFFFYSRMIKRSLEMWADWVNKVRGGITVSGKHYGVTFTWVGDSSSKAMVADAVSEATKTAQFAFAGYSSGLTAVATQQAFGQGLLLMASTAASSSVYSANNRTFGTLPPASHYHDTTIATIAEAAASRDAAPAKEVGVQADGSEACIRGGGGCLASVVVGFIQANALFTKATCAAAPGQAVARGLAVAGGNEPLVLTLARNPTPSETQEVLRVLRDRGVNVIIGCTYFSEATALISALEVMDWTPLAVAVSAAVSSSAYSSRVKAGWWQGEYIVGPTPWHQSVSGRGDVSGLTSLEFVDAYADRYDETVSYHGAATYAAACALLRAIETSHSLETSKVAQALRTLDLSEFFGPIAFNEHGQGSQPQLATQCTCPTPSLYADTLILEHVFTNVSAQRAQLIRTPDSSQDRSHVYTHIWMLPSLKRVTIVPPQGLHFTVARYVQICRAHLHQNSPTSPSLGPATRRRLK